MKPRPIDEDFLFLIYDVSQLMRRHADKRARARGMTRAQWALLSRLERQPGITQNELAALTDVEPITVGRLVDKLEQAQFVERCPDPQDRRIWRLRLTARAAPLLEEIAAFRRQLHDEMSAGIGPDVLKSLTTGLKAMRSNLAPARPGRRKEESQ